MSKRTIFIILGILLIIGLGAWLYVRNSFKTGALVDVVPSDAVLVLDNDKRIRRGRVKLTPGEHRLTVSRSGFEDSTVIFTVTDGKLTTVNVALAPNSEEGEQWLLDHPSEAIKAEGFGSQQSDETGEATLERNPLLQDLPLIDREYRIDYGPSQANPEDETAVAIYIRYSSAEGRQQALDWITDQGIDPASLEIIYKEISGF